MAMWSAQAFLPCRLLTHEAEVWTALCPKTHGLTVPLCQELESLSITVIAIRLILKNTILPVPYITHRRELRTTSMNIQVMGPSGRTFWSM
jgi:hypothetical protein